MKILSVKASGFRGIKTEIEVNFSRGFVVITGANGVGKSTICDAIEYAICGTISRLNDGEDDGEFTEYVWWRGKERPTNRFVRVIIQKDDGSQFVVERGPDGLKSTNEEEIRDYLCRKDSRPADSLHFLIRTAVLRGEQIAELSLDLQETERFKFVKACLGTKDQSDLEESASVLAKSFKQRADKLDIEYEKYRTRITDITTRISAVKAQVFAAREIAQAEAFLQAYLVKPSGDTGELVRAARLAAITAKHTQETLLSKHRELQNLDQRLAEANTDSFRTQLEQVNKALTAANIERDACQELSVTLENKLKALSSKTATLLDWTGLHQHGSALGLQDGKCPLCDQTLAEETFASRIASIKNRVDSENKTSADLLRERTKASETLRTLSAKVSALERQQRDLSSRTHALSIERAELLSLTETLGVNFVGSPDEKNDIGNAILSRTTILHEQISDIESCAFILESSKSMEMVTAFESELSKIRAESEAILRTVTNARESEERFKTAAAVIKRASAEMVDERLAELSPLLTELYGRLKPHVDWTKVSYIMRGDVRRFLSLRIGDDLNPRFMLSNGQRRAAGLAFLLAVHLSRSWCRLNTLVLDDPVQHIDDFRALHLVEVLSAIRQTGRQVICTIEDRELAQLLCRRLRSLSNEEGTFIELDYIPEEGVKLVEQKTIHAQHHFTIIAA